MQSLQTYYQRAPHVGSLPAVRGGKGVNALSIEFTVSGEQEHLNQYYALRERCFRRELGLAQFDGSEEEWDRQGDILVALWEGRCVGGARVSSRISHPSQLELLGLNSDACCMWERFAIEPSVRSIQLLHEFCASLIRFSRDTGFEHAMVLSSLRNARFYRRCHSAMGVKFRIHRPVPHCARGSFAGLEHYLSIAELQSAPALPVAVAV